MNLIHMNFNFNLKNQNDPVFKTTGWLQGVPGISGNLVVKSNLPPRSGFSLEAVEPHP